MNGSHKDVALFLKRIELKTEAKTELIEFVFNVKKKNNERTQLATEQYPSTLGNLKFRVQKNYTKSITGFRDKIISLIQANNICSLAANL